MKQTAPYSEILFGFVKKFKVKNCECECMHCKYNVVLYVL